MTGMVLSARAAAAAEREQALRTGHQLRSFPARLQLREARSATSGKDVLQLKGYASVTEVPYEMWDWLGPYTEVVSRGAFGKTLAEGADVAFLLNHGGMTLARTKPGTLRLAEDDTGLDTEADLDPRSSTVRDIEVAVERGDLDEMSFAFRIIRGKWSPDYTEYRIDEVSLHKGDVSIVNYGANPATSIGLRSAHVLGSLEHLALEQLEQVAQRAAGRAAALREQQPADPDQLAPHPAARRSLRELEYLAAL